MGHRRYILMKHQFWSMQDQFNGNTEKRHPPPHITGHKVYEMVKDVHVDLNRQEYKSESFMLAKHVAQAFYVTYLENDELSESIMPLMKKSLINLLRFLLLSH
jgi:hypothetical protein